MGGNSTKHASKAGNANEEQQDGLGLPVTAADSLGKRPSPADKLSKAAQRSFRSTKVHAITSDALGVKQPSILGLGWMHYGCAPKAVDVGVQVEPFDGAEPGPAANHGSKPSKWKKGDRIGCGSFGVVYMGLNCNTGELLAIKEVAMCAMKSSHHKEAVEQLEQELLLLRALKHPNIVRYYGTSREGNCLYIFLEYVPGGSIASLVSKFGPLDEPVIRAYTRQLLTGLLYLHAQRTVHRDIKGANLLVEKDGLVKLADFGMAKQMVEAASVTQSFKGSAYWMAPEVIRQEGHGSAADIWSVGCTVLEMATGKPPWSQCASQVQVIFKIASSPELPDMPTSLSSAAAEFIHLCLQRDAAARPSARQLLQHPFVAGPDVHVHMSMPLPNQIAAEQRTAGGAASELSQSNNAVAAQAGACKSAAASTPSQRQQHTQPPSMRGSSPMRGPSPIHGPSPKRGATGVAASSHKPGSLWPGSRAAAGTPVKAGGSSRKLQASKSGKSLGLPSAAPSSDGTGSAGMASSAPGGFRPLELMLAVGAAAHGAAASSLNGSIAQS